MSSGDDELSSWIRTLQDQRGLRITDIHVHPFDVMGVVHPTEYGASESLGDLSPGMLEKLEFGRIASLVSRMAFLALPGVADSDIRSSYQGAGPTRLLAEMDAVGVDRVGLLPVEPWSSAEAVVSGFDGERFLRFCSVNPRTVRADQVEGTLADFASRGAVGVKQHPNLQGFHPWPSQNERETAQSVREIYRVTSALGLICLFHCGRSSYGRKNRLYPDVSRSKGNAVLPNFLDSSRSVFDEISGPVILAHVGHYGFHSLDQDLMRSVVERHPNVFFDTAATGPKMIGACLDAVGSERVVLGSDATYNRMGVAVRFAYEGVRMSALEDKQEAVFNVMGGNVQRLLTGEA